MCIRDIYNSLGKHNAGVELFDGAVHSGHVNILYMEKMCIRDRPHTKENGGVFYDAATGAYTLETPDSSMFKNFYAPSTMNVYERMTVSLYNPEKVPVTVLLNFYKPYSHEAN